MVNSSLTLLSEPTDVSAQQWLTSVNPSTLTDQCVLNHQLISAKRVSIIIVGSLYLSAFSVDFNGRPMQINALMTHQLFQLKLTKGQSSSGLQNINNSRGAKECDTRR